MNGPKRLSESGSPVERSILGFARSEAPSDELARRTLAAMAAAPVAKAAQTSALSRWWRPRSIVVGVAAIGLGAAVIGSVVRHREPVAPPSISAPNVPAALSDVTPNAEAPKNEEKTEVVVTPDSLPNAPAPSSATQAPVPERSAATAPVGSASIAREVELLGDVKAKLGAGETAGAAATLDVYDSEFPRGTLRPEATVLRIRTLLLRGDRAGADKLGAAFLAEYPTGVHAKRVRALLGERRDESGPSN